MKYTLVAPAGDELENLYIGIREFPVQKIILITSIDYLNITKTFVAELRKFNVPVEIIELKNNLFEEMFAAINEIKKREKNVIINIATGDKISACVALSAAFVNGLNAFGIKDGNPVMFPILKFSYYQIVSDRKMRILKALQKGALSLEALGREVRMSLPLISYHIHGSAKSEGLLNLGLVEIKNEKSSVIDLTVLGKLLVEGYI